MSNFEPWQKYPDLTRDRLSVIATIIRDVRHRCVMLHEPDEGDGPWSLGCRAYEETRATKVNSDGDRVLGVDRVAA